MLVASINVLVYFIRLHIWRVQRTSFAKAYIVSEQLHVRAMIINHQLWLV